MSALAVAEAADVIDLAVRDALAIVAAIEEPIERLTALRDLIDRWREGEEAMLVARREMVEALNPFLSYSVMADALGCSKANIHQIRHPKR